MWSSVYDICRDRFPNAKQFLADSINYMGYSDKAELNEPGAYEQGVALRDWIAAERGFDEFPIMWGAYMWADGETERADDGFNAVCPLDYMADGIHPSNPLGAEGLAELLKDRMTELSETAVWFAP
ncbi:MAG: hypothetical protein FJZ00_05820 [Candidatus Sericytochromatia bacterium]|uniref:Uncharacterized protein n=1 Tax=Candidatus Tanganyikabacteria bacterium TaxID=2961651 RepID=A0A937X5G9_9BACT|nr:hypothetical protein [Candidatus Tanganyikabacteria bacterium]